MWRLLLGTMGVKSLPTCHVMVSMALTNQRRPRKGRNTPYAPDHELESVPGPLKRGQEKCSCPLLSAPGTNQERLFARFFFFRNGKAFVRVTFWRGNHRGSTKKDLSVCVRGRGFDGQAWHEASTRRHSQNNREMASNRQTVFRGEANRMRFPNGRQGGPFSSSPPDVRGAAPEERRGLLEV